MKTNAVNIKISKKKLTTDNDFFKDYKEIKIILQSINVKLGFLEI